MATAAVGKGKLTPNQETFCRLYASDKEFFCNGVKAYMEAYGKESYGSAGVEACKLLKKPKILDRIDELLEYNGLNDVFVDKQLYKLIQQEVDYSTKVAAIREYNKLKQRITDKKEVVHSFSLASLHGQD